MKKTRAATIAVMAIAAAATGCSTMMVKMNGLSNYVEKESNGRIYVMSSPEAISEFETTGGLSIAKTRIGAGPNRETVVLDADRKDSSRDEALWKIFKRRHGM
jgi:hypothetical protein